MSLRDLGRFADKDSGPAILPLNLGTSQQSLEWSRVENSRSHTLHEAKIGTLSLYFRMTRPRWASHHKNQCGTVSRGPAAFNRVSRARDSYLEGPTSLHMIGARTQLLIHPEQIPVLEFSCNDRECCHSLFHCPERSEIVCDRMIVPTVGNREVGVEGQIDFGRFGTHRALVRCGKQ